MNTIRFLLSILGVFTLLLTGRAAAQAAFDKALSFDGSGQYVAVPSAVWFNGSFTVESWVYVRSHQNYARLMDFGNGREQNVVLCALSQGTSGRPLFEIYNGTTSGGIVTAPSPLPLNTWTHLAFTFGAGTGKIFVNGEEVASGPMSSPANVTRTNNFIGRSNWPLDSYADAVFDEFRLWNTARTQAQIQASRYTSLAGNEPGLQLYYRFDSDSVAVNYANNSATSAGNGFRGSLINQPAWVASMQSNP